MKVGDAIMKYPKTAKRLADALSKIGMNQQTLSDKTGIGKASISQYINGSHKPSTDSAKRMAEVLGVHPFWLQGYDESAITPIEISPKMADLFAGTFVAEHFKSSLYPFSKKHNDKYLQLELYLQSIGFNSEEAKDICRYAKFRKNENQE